MPRHTIESPETSEIHAFVAVVEAGSVSAAADELSIPRATISRRLARLEERLGVRLMHRTTRQQQLTELGEEYYTHARSILTAVEVATRAITQDDEHPKGLLRVSAPLLSASGLDHMLLDFLEGFVSSFEMGVSLFEGATILQRVARPTPETVLIELGEMTVGKRGQFVDPLLQRITVSVVEGCLGGKLENQGVFGR